MNDREDSTEGSEREGFDETDIVILEQGMVSCRFVGALQEVGNGEGSKRSANV